MSDLYRGVFEESFQEGLRIGMIQVLFWAVKEGHITVEEAAEESEMVRSGIQGNLGKSSSVGHTRPLILTNFKPFFGHEERLFCAITIVLSKNFVYCSNTQNAQSPIYGYCKMVEWY